VCHVHQSGGIAIVNSRPFFFPLAFIQVLYTDTGHNVDIPQRNLRSVETSREIFQLARVEWALWSRSKPVSFHAELTKRLRDIAVM